MAHGKPALPSRLRAQCRRVHRIPFPTSVTIAKRPSVGQDGGDVELIWVSREREYFCEQDWTAQITLIRFNKSHRSRKAYPTSLSLVMAVYALSLLLNMVQLSR
jgi:hypothetical protein